MFDRAVSNTAIRYGVTGGLCTFAFIVILALLGYESPYGDTSEFSTTLVFVPVFVFLAIRYYKKFAEAELGFGKAFKVGFATTVYLAFTSAVLMCIFSLLFGGNMIQEYIILMQQQMQANKAELVKLMGETNYNAAFVGVKDMNAYQLAQRTFLYRFGMGFFVSLVFAVFFRK